VGKVVKKKNSWWALMKERKRESNYVILNAISMADHMLSLSLSL